MEYPFGAFVIPAPTSELYWKVDGNNFILFRKTWFSMAVCILAFRIHFATLFNTISWYKNLLIIFLQTFSYFSWINSLNNLKFHAYWNNIRRSNNDIILVNISLWTLIVSFFSHFAYPLLRIFNKAWNSAAPRVSGNKGLPDGSYNLQVYRKCHCSLLV